LQNTQLKTVLKRNFADFPMGQSDIYESN